MRQLQELCDACKAVVERIDAGCSAEEIFEDIEFINEITGTILDAMHEEC